MYSSYLLMSTASAGGGEGVRETRETVSSSLSSVLSPWSDLDRWRKGGREEGSTACFQGCQGIRQSTFSSRDAPGCSSSSCSGRVIGMAVHRATLSADMSAGFKQQY